MMLRKFLNFLNTALFVKRSACFGDPITAEEIKLINMFRKNENRNSTVEMCGTYEENDTHKINIFLYHLQQTKRVVG